MLYHFVKLKVTEIVTKKHNTAYLKLTLFILNGSNPLSYLSVTVSFFPITIIQECVLGARLIMTS